MGHKKILSGTNIIREDLIGSDTLITQALLRKTLFNSKDYLAIPDIGLAFGQQLPLAAHGILGAVAIGSPTVIEGFNFLKQFIKLRTKFFQLSVGVESHSTRLCFHISDIFLESITEPDELPLLTKQFLTESALAISLNTISEILGYFEMTNFNRASKR